MDGFERRKQMKKQAIIHAGLELFQQNGIKNVSINEIATHANVSQVTIYNYFESKEKLQYEVLIQFIHDYWNEYKTLIDSNLSFTEKLRIVMFDKAEAARKIHTEFYAYLIDELSKNDSYLTNLYQQEIIPSVMELFNQGREAKAIDPNLSNEAIMFYMQMFTDYMRREDVISQALPLTDELTQIFFYGITGNKNQ
ncbi:TetR/AcrR family transcriptional regulator [Oceanobacillus sp. 1P07AA]|uniref:TetR/AcrR family transcriptional regulator n=1 Tax=Oceanobacillus sp. 1P07AA TaxID=3132293 RepID=UPI0039A56243